MLVVLATLIGVLGSYLVRPIMIEDQLPAQ